LEAQLAGQAVFPNEKREFQRAAHKTVGQAGGLHKRAVRGIFHSLLLCTAYLSTLLCNRLSARPSVQLASPPKIMLFIWKHSPPARWPFI